MKKLPISLIVLTHNEELNLDKCLSSADGFVNEIIVLDSFSVDTTLEIASKYTNNIYKNEFVTHSKQWKWSLENIEINNEWVIGLDADQTISDKLKRELTSYFSDDTIYNFDGIYVRRKQIFLGKWIKHGGYYPKYLLKIFNKNKVVIDEDELLDHHFSINGRTLTIESDIIENNLKENNLSFWFNKHINYAEKLAIESINSVKNKNANEAVNSNPDQKTARLKKVYNMLPLFIRPFIYFTWRYFFQLGFLDGTRGFIFHFFQSLCFRFIVDAKIYELRIINKRNNNENTGN